MTEDDLKRYEALATTYPRPMVGEAPGDVILKLVAEVRFLGDHIVALRNLLAEKDAEIARLEDEAMEIEPPTSTWHADPT